MVQKDKVRLSFGCDEAKTRCNKKHHPGFAKSSCCLQDIGDAVLTFTKECKVTDYGIHTYMHTYIRMTQYRKQSLFV